MKCPNCGKEVVRFPIKDEQGNINWKNLFKIDWMSILFLVAIVFMTIVYVHDTKQCKEIISNPVEFCEDNNYCENNFNILPLEEEDDKWQTDLNVPVVGKE